VALALVETVPELMGKLHIGRATSLLFNNLRIAVGSSVSVDGQKGFLIGFIAWSPAPRVRNDLSLFLLLSFRATAEGLVFFDLGALARDSYPISALTDMEKHSYS
jgi:hypothetical protein